MIETVFEKLFERNAEPITVMMPFPIREGESIEFNDTSWRVIATYWVIDTDPETMTRTVKLRVRIQ
jgi:hypothetical protein